MSPEKPVIRFARTLSEMQQIYKLTHECYVASGYCAPKPAGMIVHYPDFDHLPESTHLIAVLGEKVVGAMSLTEDGPGGFTIEDDFKKECEAIRQEGLKVGSLWRLVVDESTREGRVVVIALMQAIHALLLEQKIETALMVINPKHESVYKRACNATIVARRNETRGLSNAPAVLMRFDPAGLPPNSVFSSQRTRVPAISDLILNSNFLNLFSIQKNSVFAF